MSDSVKAEIDSTSNGDTNWPSTNGSVRLQSDQTPAFMVNGFNGCASNGGGQGAPMLSAETGGVLSHSHQLGRIEICQKQTSEVDATIIKMVVGAELRMISSSTSLRDISLTKFSSPYLTEHVDSVTLQDSSLHLLPRDQVHSLWPKIDMYVYRLHESGCSTEQLCDEGGASEEEEELPAANHWLLPSSEFKDLWENLVYDNNIKDNLIQYARTALLFSDNKVNPSIINWNRLILLHGPPGTGKTSLCKAVAQKLCIMMSERYQYGQLIEINSHSLFSRWFSESGKLVMKMFKKIEEFVSDKNALVCVLIDEVESLSACRQSMSGSEPSDAIRVVNALLTQLDLIRRHPNVLVMTTSNITGSIDAAFLDRADIRQYIGLPSPSAIYQIYHSCILELAKAGILADMVGLIDRHTLDYLLSSSASLPQIYDHSIVKVEQCSSSAADTLGQGSSVTKVLPLPSQRLLDIARQSVGLSGRTLRKLPFVSHALFLQIPRVSLDDFLTALRLGVERHFSDGEALQEPSLSSRSDPPML